MGKLLKWVVTLGIIPAIVIYLTRTAPDVRYTLSDRIPTALGSTSGAPPQTVQQLEVKNIGNEPANKIVVRISKEIGNYSIGQYSAADEVQTFPDRQRERQLSLINAILSDPLKYSGSKRMTTPSLSEIGLICGGWLSFCPNYGVGPM